MARMIEIPAKFLKDIEEELDTLIQTIDHSPDEIDESTTNQARALLIKLGRYLE